MRVHARVALGRVEVLVTEQLLDLLPLPRIAKAITSDSEGGRALRQSSPFAGSLTEHERRRIAQAVEEHAAR